MGHGPQILSALGLLILKVVEAFDFSNSFKILAFLHKGMLCMIGLVFPLSLLRSE